MISPFSTSSKTVLTICMIALCGNFCTVNKKASGMVIGVCISKFIVIKPEATDTSAVQLSPLQHRLKNSQVKREVMKCRKLRHLYVVNVQ